MVSGMDGNLGGCDHVYGASRGVWPSSTRRVNEMDSYCLHCDTRCFVNRVFPDGRWVQMHTCFGGMDADLAAFGHNYLTATNPYRRQAA